ncbi:glycoside hydrolase family 99-like domain-containing protein [Gulosibacter bifidus]|uniref:Glycoside hydrolase family 99-like domain-containing protein n=1 Tax=Gulosibacter bifidus TaxID=272239 RepID=A0ABW5RHM2_9MICO|nr:glycoside hydrolase family 99-like domain-containing protein [Gulosibacter bifidus]
MAGRTRVAEDSKEGCGFGSWLHRYEGMHFVGFPAKWRVDFPPFVEPAPIGVHLHVYYDDLVSEIVEQLANIKVPFDVIVTNASNATITEADILPSGAKNVRILPVENHGRDIWPLLQVVNAGMLDPYDLVFKIHTKKSAWREQHETLSGSGDQWKEGFYRDLLGTPENVETILNAFAANPGIGVVTSEGSIAYADQWGGDEEHVKQILRRIRLPHKHDDLEFPSGSIYWIRGFVLQGLRSLMMDRPDFETEAGQIDGTTAHAIERLIGILALEAGYVIQERQDVEAVAEPLDRDGLVQVLSDPEFRAKAMAFYLPQFHTFPENDAWWGKGFTEWTNVSKAKPVFQGHPQPLLPAELGFYDLRMDEVREEQTKLAKAFGVHAFMYYYYWFSGHKLMEMPINRLVESDIDQPFCIMWANENWTRRWDGDSKNVLIAQEYDKVPAENFIDDVMPLLQDERYLRVDGAAVLAVYRIAQLPNYQQVIEEWRRRAREAGVGELHLMSVDVGANFDGLNASYMEAGIQGALAFPPHNHEYIAIAHDGLGVRERFQGGLFSYQGMCNAAIARLRGDFPETDFPGAMVGFDNTARRQWEPHAWVGANPYTFRRWMRATVEAVALRDPDHRIVIVNAWNEWAESAVLEPTQRWGFCYLQALRAALI